VEFKTDEELIIVEDTPRKDLLAECISDVEQPSVELFSPSTYFSVSASAISLLRMHMEPVALHPLAGPRRIKLISAILDETRSKTFHDATSHARHRGGGD